MTLLSGLELGVAACLSASPDSSRWRALRAARSLMARGVDGDSLLTVAALVPPLLPLPLFARSHTSPELPAAGTGERGSSGTDVQNGVKIENHLQHSQGAADSEFLVQM